MAALVTAINVGAPWASCCELPYRLRANGVAPRNRAQRLGVLVATLDRLGLLVRRELRPAAKPHALILEDHFVIARRSNHGVESGIPIRRVRAV